MASSTAEKLDALSSRIAESIAKRLDALLSSLNDLTCKLDDLHIVHRHELDSMLDSKLSGIGHILEDLLEGASSNSASSDTSADDWRVSQLLRMLSQLRSAAWATFFTPFCNLYSKPLLLERSSPLKAWAKAPRANSDSRHRLAD